MKAYIVDLMNKLGTLLGSRRFWVTVVTVAVAVAAVYNAIGAPFGLDPITVPDPDQTADDIMVYASAVQAIIQALVILLGGGTLLYSYTQRPPTRKYYE